MDKSTRWSSTTLYVDMETGEQLTKYNYTKNYIKHETRTHTTFTNDKARGHIERTIVGRRKPQLRISNW